MTVATEEAKKASEQALLQVARLWEEQQKTTQQMSQVLSMQAGEAQRKIQDAMQVAVQTQYDSRGISHIVKKAEMTALKAAIDTETQIHQMAQKLQEQQMQYAIQAQATKQE